MTRAAIALRRSALCLLALATGACSIFQREPAHPAPPDAPSGASAGVPVDIENQSRPVLCAEEDNVSIAASGRGVRSFRIEVAHPVYAPMLRRDNKEADWTACDMRADPVHAPSEPPKQVTVYEDERLQIVGYTQPSFWRPTTARFRVGERVEPALHFLQVWLREADAREEVLVLYPQDGYWRARPLAPPELKETAYGSSFLIGPIEHAGRPIVQLEEVAFDPPTRTFTLRFARGGSARLTMLQVDRERHALDVRFDAPIEGRPFAMLRSMYITEFNNDVARIAVREPGAAGWREDNIMQFERARATDVWMGRLSPSQHNTSSPDTIFHGFSETSEPRRPARHAPAP